MNSPLEKIVASRELCAEVHKKYPEAFRDSVFVWQLSLVYATETHNRDCFTSTTGTTRRTDYIYDIGHRRIADLRAEKLVPAPTIAEILEALPGPIHLTKLSSADQYCVCSLSIGIDEMDNPTNAALRLWMKIQEACK